MASVKDILDKKGHAVWTISPDAAVLDALNLMADRAIGALIVMEKDDIVGVISERDYARKMVLEGKFSKDTPVRDIMSTCVCAVCPETTAEECMIIMTDKRLRHLPVCETRKLVGVISIGDIVKDIISQQQVTIEYLENYIGGRYPC